MEEGKPPIKVLRLIARMNVGGPAVQISGLMKDLPRHEFDQVLVTGYCDEDEKDYLDESEVDFKWIRVQNFGRKIGFLSDLKAFCEIRSIIKKFEPTILHTHTAKAGFIGRMAVQTLIKKPIMVHTFHGHLLKGYFGVFKTWLVAMTEKFLSIDTDSLIAVGNQVKVDLLRKGIGNSGKFTVISPGIELGVIPQRNKALKKLGLTPMPFTVSWVGRVTEIKAPSRILDIARCCINLDPEINFIVVGEGPLLQSLKEIAFKERLPIKFLGWQKEIEPILAITDLMILTSINEGMPVSLIEAQMAGVPVLSTNVGSVSEVISNQTTGYCIQYSPEVFSDIIFKLKRDSNLRENMGRVAKIRSNQEFSRKRLVGAHRSLYFELSSQSNSLPKAPE